MNFSVNHLNLLRFLPGLHKSFWSQDFIQTNLLFRGHILVSHNVFWSWKKLHKRKFHHSIKRRLRCQSESKHTSCANNKRMEPIIMVKLHWILLPLLQLTKHFGLDRVYK